MKGLCNRKRNKMHQLGSSSRNEAFLRNAESMVLGSTTNCLLVKDDVGKSKPATHSIPGAGFAYGKKSNYTESA